MTTSPSKAAVARVWPRVGRSRARALIVAALASVSAAVGSAGCGGRTALDVSGGIALPSDGGAPGAASSGSAEDTSSVATLDAGDAAACTTPGIYLVTGLSQDGPYSLAVFEPTTGYLDPLGSIDVPPPPICSDGAPVTSVTITREGQITITCNAYLLALDDELATTSPIYAWPRVDGGTWGFVEMTALGSADGGQRLLGVGPPIGLGEVDFGASSPAFSVGMLDVNWLNVYGAIVPGDGPLLTLETPLAATGDGRLFTLSYFLADGGEGPAITQIDPVTAEPIAQVDVAVTWDDLVHPVAFWGGDFYTFPPAAADAGAAGQTEIVRLHPGASTRETVATVEGVVVAASTSPCAPIQ